MHVGRLNEQAEGSVDRALTFEQQLAAVYAGQLRRAARYAASRFRELAPVRFAVTAAVNPTPPDWSPPDHDELQDEPLTGRAATQARRIHLQAVAAALPAVLAERLDDIGVAYDIGSPFADSVLAKVGTKGVNLGLATRDVILKVIEQAYAQGWTIAKTADALQSEIGHLSTTTAVMQARTDLVGLANGSSLAAVQALGDDAPPVKIWVATADERTRETHADADGQEVPIDQPFQVGDDLLNYPGDPDGSDAETINCRCSVIYGDTATPSDGQVDEEALAAAAVPPLSSGRPTGEVASGTVDVSPESLTAGVTITVDGDEPDTDDMATTEPVRWRAILCVEGEPSQDGPSLVRMLQPGGGSWRDVPLPLGVMFETPHADDVTAVVCGRIDTIYRDSIDNRVIWGEGIFNPDEVGAQAAEYVGNLSLRGVSIDPYVADLTVTELEAPTEEAPLGKTLMTFVDYVIGGATICPFQALESATIAIIASGDGGEDARVITPTWFIRGPLPEPAADDALVAAAAVKAAPREWFETQEPPGLMPLTVTADGRVFGHLASWDVCHTAFAEACVRPPRSASNYGYFHVGEVETADGPVAVGKLMVAKPGRAGKHASLNASRAEASRHYDDNTAVGAYIRVVDGRYGPWAVGVVRPGLDDDSLAQLRANPPSGDWRRVNGSLELIAALSVPVPGFPVPRADAALVASGDLVEVDALIACSGELVETPTVRRALERAGVIERIGPEPTDARIVAKAARAQGRDALVAAALRES